ncbi:MAG: glycosyltransferase [Lachnospiraceae bacterium]|nr:glycosyltransferase [Lachnospiraceae bacterium]
MKAIVCISNNVVRDSRVKRQINALADEYEQVHVVAVAQPDPEFGVKRENVTYSFAEIKHNRYPATVQIREKLKAWDLYSEMKKYCPILESDRYNSYFEMKYICKQFHILTSSGRYEEIQNRNAEKMKLEPAISYIIYFLENSIEIALEAQKYDADVIVCNDEDTLLAGVLHKKNKGTRLIYDVHDLLSDVTENVFPLIYSEMLCLYEKNMIHYADAVIGAGKYLLEWVGEHYELNVPVIPIFNCGNSEEIHVEKKKFDAPNIRFYYQGLAYPNRNLELLIEAAKGLKNVEIVIRSDENEYIESIKKLAAGLDMDKSVTFLKMVPTEEVYSAANRDGDIGVYLADPQKSINWKASFTNKFLEYLVAGLPVITTDARDQAEVVKKYQCGYVLKSNSIEELRRLLIKIVENRDELKSKSECAMHVGKEIFNWDIYRRKMLDVFRGKTKSEISLKKGNPIWISQELEIEKLLKKIHSSASVIKYYHIIKFEKELNRDETKGSI